MKPPVEDHADRDYLLTLGAFSALVLVFILSSREPGREDRPLGAWLRDLEARQTYRRTEAQDALRRLGWRVLPHLVDRLATGDTNLQTQAVLAFAALGDEARPAIPQLTELLRHERTALPAARSLAAIGPASLSPLTNSLASPFRPVRTSCARALGRVRGDARPAVPALVSVLDDEDDELRYFATRSLGHLAMAPVQSVPALVTRLQDRNAEVRKVAARSLGQFQGRARVAVPALVKALDDQDLGMKLTAALALREINPGLAGELLK